jgi:hypothetical protein
MNMKYINVEYRSGPLNFKLLGSHKKEGLFYVGDYRKTLDNIANPINFKPSLIAIDTA